MRPGWTQTDAPECDNVADAATIGHTTHLADLDFENREQVTKTFELTYPAAPEGVTFSVDYLIGAGPVQHLDLAPAGGKFTASVPVMAVTTIASWQWFAHYQGMDILLGSGGPETISQDTTNTFTYNADLSGIKYEDVDGNGNQETGEGPLGGWTIALFRQIQTQQTPSVGAAAIETTPSIPAGYAYVGQRVTAADGSYKFEGLLPGMYYLAEVPQAGWTRTESPAGPIEVSDGTSISGLDFGNWLPFITFEEPDLGIHKSVTPTIADPNEVLTYKLTYYNDGKASATDFRIVDDFDERYVDVVDAAGGTVAGGKITWTLAGPLAPGASGTIIYKMKVKADVADGTKIDNTVTIDFPDDPTLDKTPADNVDKARVIVELPFLPFTGIDLYLLLLAAAVLALAGVALRRIAHRVA
jgi:hypothetical protein